MIAKIKGNINWWKEGFKDRGFKIRFLSAIIGFGISGILWGIECYSGTIARNEALANPFSFILGAICFGIIGSFSLMIFREKEIKKILKFVLIGLITWLVAFVLPYFFSYFLFLFSGIILTPIIIVLSWFFSHQEILEILILKPSLRVAHFSFEFFFTGIIFSLLLNLILKIKLSSVLKIGIVFVIVSIISPIAGNLLGKYLFSSLFLSYIVTFLLIGIGFGLPIFKLLEKQKTQ